MNLEDRIYRRMLVELDEDLIDENGDGPSEDEDGVQYLQDPTWETHVSVPQAARLAALEAEDTANPIAATAIVRKDAVTEIAPPDVEALLAAFNRPEDDQ